MPASLDRDGELRAERPARIDVGARAVALVVVRAAGPREGDGRGEACRHLRRDSPDPALTPRLLKGLPAPLPLKSIHERLLFVVHAATTPEG